MSFFFADAFACAPRQRAPAERAAGGIGNDAGLNSAFTLYCELLATLARVADGYEHTLAAGVLPAIHADPFDRIIIAQMQCEDMTCATRNADALNSAVSKLKAKCLTGATS